ncbi:MAG: MauE/DoxX family redox-associated membrane protein [Elusimicrobiales bacterium]
MAEGNTKIKDLAGPLSRLIVGCLFVYAGALKVAAPVEEFAKAIESYLVFAAGPSLLAAYVVPWIEIYAGALLAIGFFTRYTGLFIAAMLLFFEVLLGQAWLRNLPVIYCGCFGSQWKTSVPQEFLQNLLLLGLLWPGLRLGQKFTADALMAPHSGTKLVRALILAACVPALMLPFIAERYRARKPELPPTIEKQNAVTAQTAVLKPVKDRARKSDTVKPVNSGSPAIKPLAAGLVEINPGYARGRDAGQDINAALSLATEGRKRVMVKVGGYWCKWCVKMDQFFNENPDVNDYLGKNFIVVNVYFNPSEPPFPQAIAAYPRINGTPHIYILEKDGTMLESKDTVHLEAGEGYDHGKIMAFLEQWAVEKPGIN